MKSVFDDNEEVGNPIEENKTEDFNIKADGELIIDSQEPDKIVRLIIKNGIKYRIEKLPVGDFKKGNVIVERKTMGDFITSMRGRHLQKQLMQMEANYDRSFLIISGGLKDTLYNPHTRGWTTNHHMGALASIAVRYPKVKVLQVENDTQLVNLMLRIMVKAFDGKVPDIMDTELMAMKMTTKNVKIKMLSCIPKVGLEKAKVLRKTVDVCLLNRKTRTILEEEDLFDVPGVGPIMAEEIVKINRKKVKMK